MTPVIKWKGLPVCQEFKDYGWQKRLGLKLDPDKYYFEFKIGVIDGRQKIIIEAADIRQPASPSEFSLTAVNGKITEWSLDRKRYTKNCGWRNCSLFQDFLGKAQLDSFPEEYRKFVTNL
jgi:hypothetical protein